MVHGFKKILLVVINDDQFYCSNFLPLFKKMKDKGYFIHVASKDSGLKNKIEEEGFIFHNIRFNRRIGNPFSNFFIFLSLIRLYKRIQPSIIHHITLKVILMGTIASIFVTKNKIVNHFCGLGYIFSLPKRNFLKTVVKLFLNVVFRIKRSSLLFENEDDKNEIFKIVLKTKSSFFIINGTGIDLIEYKYFPLINNSFVKILFPGRLIYTKGLIDFFKAADILRSNYEGRVKFILAGRVDFENSAYISESVIRSRLINGYVEWIGFTDDMKEEMQASDVIVLPSYREGLPRVLVEACAIGRAIITTSVPGCRNCVKEGYNGFLIPVQSPEVLAQKLKTLINDKEFRIQMGNNSRKFAEVNFDLNLIASALDSIYR